LFQPPGNFRATPPPAGQAAPWNIQKSNRRRNRLAGSKCQETFVSSDEKGQWIIKKPTLTISQGAKDYNVLAEKLFTF
jgi:hypothetical protein